MEKQATVMLLTFTIVVSLMSFGIACPPQCKCTAGGFVNCSRQDLDQIPDGFPKDTTGIDLSINNIKVVLANKFNYLPLLNSLDLSSNQIDVIGDVEAFLHNPALETLNLGSNSKLSKIPRLPASLKTLYMYYADLTELLPNTFDNTTKLLYLALDNNGITSLPEGVFSKLSSFQFLRIAFNKLSDDSFPDNLFDGLEGLQSVSLRFNAFKNIPKNLPSGLQYLDMVGNQLTVIPAKSFSTVTQLQVFEAWQNQIREIEDGTFEGMNKMKILDINTNHITKLSNATLRGLTNLQTIYLDLNNITFIESGAFDSLKMLTQLWMMFNPIITMSPNLLSRKTLPELSRAYLAGSAWVCDCHLRWLRELEDSSSLLDSPHLMVCAAPPKLKGKAFDELKASDFRCNETKSEL